MTTGPRPCRCLGTLHPPARRNQWKIYSGGALTPPVMSSKKKLLQLLLVLQQGLSAVICFILLLLSTTISSLRCYLGNINWPYVRSLFMALGNNALRIQTLVHRPLVPFGYEEFFYRYLP